MIFFPSAGGAFCAPFYAMVQHHGQDQAMNQAAVVFATVAWEGVILSAIFLSFCEKRTVCGLALLSAVFWRTCQSVFLSAILRHEWKRLFLGNCTPSFGDSFSAPLYIEREVLYAA